MDPAELQGLGDAAPQPLILLQHPRTVALPILVVVQRCRAGREHTFALQSIDGLRIPRCCADQPPNVLTSCACHCCGDAIAGGCCCLVSQITLARPFDVQQSVCGMLCFAHVLWPPSSHDRHTACSVLGYQPCAKASSTTTDVCRPSTLYDSPITAPLHVVSRP